jgi:hypothetical protein
MKKFFALLTFCFATAAAPPALALTGCLGAKANDCIDAIKPYLDALSYQRAHRNIERFLAGDIAGKRSAKGIVSVAYHSKFDDQFALPLEITMEYGPTLDVTELSLSLHKGTGTAETDEDYQATHMYEAALFALGTRENCPELASAHNYYLFFHTKVRNHLKAQKLARISGSFNPPSSDYAETGWIGICGRKMNFVVSSAEWGSVGADMSRRYGVGGSSLYFK